MYACEILYALNNITWAKAVWKDKFDTFKTMGCGNMVLSNQKIKPWTGFVADYRHLTAVGRMKFLTKLTEKSFLLITAIPT